MTGLVKLLKCPYCPRGRGIIAADVDRVIRATAAGHEFRGRDGSFLVYDPDVPESGGPCPHVISHIIDVSVIAPRQRADGPYAAPRTVASATYGWDHPWFATVGEYVLGEHLWCEVNGGDDVAFHPASPHRIRFLGRSRRLADSPNRLELGGTVILAMRPEVFMEELRDGEERLQKYYDRRLSETS